MISVIEPANCAIVIDDYRRSKLDPHRFMALVFQVREAMRALSETIEHRFATFAAVPYHDPVSRRQWEQVWETEAELSDEQFDP